MRYLPHTDADRRAMLAAIGVRDAEELFKDIPVAARLAAPVDLPYHQGEIQVERAFTRMAGRNLSAATAPFFIGAGLYRHHIPAAVDQLLTRGEFLTSYTPYQPEVSQGTLQYFSFDDLNGKRIGTIRGYYLPNDLKEYMLKHCVVEEVTREEQNFLKLVAKRVDLIMSEECIGTYFAHKLWIEENVMPLLQPQKSIIGYVSTHHLMFSKKVVTQEFVDEFSRKLKEFKSTEEYETMRARYQYKGDDTGAVLRDMEY